tara:strand:+ start:1825 stop:2073 length:249 start_codon:yes stop_codon:yes gene_type:complete
MIVRCRECNKELSSHPTKTKCCGCPNMTTVRGDNVSALDLSRVIMIDSGKKRKDDNVLSPQDLSFQEERRKRKVRKMDFEIR